MKMERTLFEERLAANKSKELHDLRHLYLAYWRRQPVEVEVPPDTVFFD